MSSMVNFNGNLLSSESLFLNHKNRAMRYGDALSETFRVINGTLIFWEDHYQRLMASMRILRMEIPMSFTMEFLEEQVLNTLSANELIDCPAIVHILVFREGVGSNLPESNDVAFCIEVSELDSSFYIAKEGRYEVELFRDFYLNADMLSTLNTNNKILNVVGSIFAEENDYDDCLLLNHEKMVVAALSGNLFLIKGNTIKTPPLRDGCPNGVIRKRIIKLIEGSTDREFEENSISPFELQKADEIFITNIEDGIRPITKYRKKEFANSVSKKLLEMLNEQVDQE
ncbi:MAG: aminotransferase class IV [Aurantibacter sp.]